MIKKTVKYVDFNGNENNETFYFNLTKAELTMLELSYKGGLSSYIEEAVKSGDNAKLIEVFNKLILESYGVKSEDGKRFVKNSEIKEEFKNSAAFSEIFMSIATNAEEAEVFVKGISNN